MSSIGYESVIRQSTCTYSVGYIYIVTDTKIASSQLLKKAVNETPPSSYEGVDKISIYRCKKNKAVWRIVVRLWVQAINTQLNDFLNYYFLYMSTMIIFYLRYYIFILVITWVKGRGTWEKSEKRK